MSTPFNPSALKPGDEVGKRWTSWLGECVFTTTVVAIHDGGIIEVEGDEFYGPDGLQVDLVINGIGSPIRPRLCEPTDEGRRNSLSEDIGADLDSLGDRRSDLSLDELQRLDAAIKALLSEFPPRAVIDVPSVEEANPTLKLVHGG
jgi:hypothetical protein